MVCPWHHLRSPRLLFLCLIQPCQQTHDAEELSFSDDYFLWHFIFRIVHASIFKSTYDPSFVHASLFYLYQRDACACAGFFRPAICALLAFYALYGNRQSIHPRIQRACCRYDLRRIALLRDAKPALRAGALLHDRSSCAIECAGGGSSIILLSLFKKFLTYFSIHAKI